MSSVIRGSDDFDSADLFGSGQTWQDVTASRATATTYTNSTDKPIAVSITTTDFGTGDTMLVDGNLAGRFPANAAFIFVIVPAGSTYQLTGTQTLNKWLELR